MKAVSYTHLDVYKRQDWAVTLVKPGQAFTRLLVIRVERQHIFQTGTHIVGSLNNAG